MRLWPGWKLVLLLGIAVCCAPESPADTAETPEALVQRGLEQLGYFDFEKAHKAYKEAQLRLEAQGDQQSPLWQDAVYGRAVCAQHISPSSAGWIDEAAGLYRRVAEKTPRSKYAPRSVLNLGRIAELRDYHGDRIDVEQARQHYQAVVERWPEDPIAGEATLRIAATYVQTYDRAQAARGVELLERWLAAHPKDPLASIMWQYLGDTYFRPLAEHRKALDCYVKADGLGLYGKGKEGVLYWRMAVLADQYVNDRPLAVRYYTKIITDTPTSGKAHEAQLALERLGAPVPRIILFELMAQGAPPPAPPSAPPPGAATQPAPTEPAP